MTICVGILSGEGIVIAADTEEGDGDTERDQQKLFNFCGGVPHPESDIPPETSGILTGAGDAGYLDAFFYLLSKGAVNHVEMDDFEKYMADETVFFHDRHIFPISSRDQTPRIMSVLAAITCGWKTALFVTNGSTVRKVYTHIAIGIGQPFAQTILNQQTWCQTMKRGAVACRIRYIRHKGPGSVVWFAHFNIFSIPMCHRYLAKMENLRIVSHRAQWR